MKRVNQLLYWTPRIAAILLILFLAMFSLDVITPEATFWQIVTGMLMHNIPVFILIAVLIVAWRFEWVGGVAFILAGLAYVILASTRGISWFQAFSWSMILAGPAFIVGGLFLANWYLKGRTAGSD